MDASMLEQQAAMLPMLIDGVRQNPGFLRGYWTADVEDPSVSVTFIVFEELEQAQAFRTAVMANAPAQAESGVKRDGLRIVKISGEA